ncbi:hypothetical protein EVAR_5537_1 [Eumeta japonica]|uniref:Uncharacterized protein n=1 Tax=Eumeta variegata TaxID=151549 RepID=A0A4C1T9Z5_EUMVA|nr:hypothetical protein EVAR_5537_1 [Eumeta japonica]
MLNPGVVTSLVTTAVTIPRFKMGQRGRLVARVLRSEIKILRGNMPQQWEFKRGRVNPSDEFRDDRLSSAVNHKNIDAVRRMIETDKHVTHHEIRVLAVDPTQFDRDSKNGPRYLVQCNITLIRFKERASNLVWDIVTGDETWIYCYDSKTKQQSIVWVYLST